MSLHRLYCRRQRQHIHVSFRNILCISQIRGDVFSFLLLATRILNNQPTRSPPYPNALRPKLKREHRAIAEAERWATWQLLLKDKKRAYEKARRRTMTELKSALDAGGSVWVFGTGPFGEFTAPAPKVLKQGRHEFAHYDVIRVRPIKETGRM